MADNRDYMTRQEEMGSIQISEDVVASIAINAAKETEGVSGFMNANMSDIMGGKKLTARGVRVETADGELTVISSCAMAAVSATWQRKSSRWSIRRWRA